MNILYVCHRFPFPPKRGGKIRPFNMIRHLSESGHKVTVCSLARSPQEAEEGRGIAPSCASFEIGLVRAVTDDEQPGIGHCPEHRRPALDQGVLSR